MQIREQGRKVQCIRSEYDPSIRRSRQKVVATLARWTHTMPTEGLDELTDDERKTLADWLAAKQDQSQQATRAYAARSAATWLGDLSAALASGETDMTPEKAAAIWKGLGDVAKALRKAGHAKPKAVRKVASKEKPAMPVKVSEEKAPATKPTRKRKPSVSTKKENGKAGA